MRQPQPTKVKKTTTEPQIFQQGAPLVNGPAVLLHTSARIVCLELDLASKWCEASGDGTGPDGPEIMIETSGRTKSSCGSVHPRYTGPTVVRFPEYAGWSVFTAVCCRYTLRAVLIKKRKEVRHPLVS